MHTEVVWCVVSWAVRIQSTIGPAVAGHLAGDDARRARGARPGSARRRTCGRCRSTSSPLSSGSGPVCSAQTTTSSAGQVGEDLVRADGVEGGELGVEADGDLHGSTLPRIGGGGNDGSPTDPASVPAWQPGTVPEMVPYDEFGLFHENAEEFGLPYDGPPTVRREEVEVAPGRRLSALVWGDRAAGARAAARRRAERAHLGHGGDGPRPAPRGDRPARPRPQRRSRREQRRPRVERAPTWPSPSRRSRPTRVASSACRSAA